MYVYFNKSPCLFVPNFFTECHSNSNDFFTTKSLLNTKKNAPSVPKKTIDYNIVCEHDVNSLKVFRRILYKTLDNHKYKGDPSAIDLDDIIDYKMCNIKVVVNSSKFSLSHKIIDRIINTIGKTFNNNEFD